MVVAKSVTGHINHIGIGRQRTAHNVAARDTNNFSGVPGNCGVVAASASECAGECAPRFWDARAFNL